MTFSRARKLFGFLARLFLLLPTLFILVPFLLIVCVGESWRVRRGPVPRM